MERKDCARTARRTVPEWELVDPNDCVLQDAQCVLQDALCQGGNWPIQMQGQDSARVERRGTSKRNKAVGRA